jgi:hypothetical protein
VVECQSIRKKELSKKLDQSQTLSSLTISQELEELELEVEIINLELLDLRKETLTGHLKLSPEKQESLT